MTLRISGNGSRVIVWLHGFCLSSEIWNPCLPLFGEEYTSVCIDLPGFGDSPLTHFLDLRDLGSQIYGALVDKGIKKASFIGHSLGGYISMEILRDQPSFCESLVLFHSNAFPDSEQRKATRKLYLDAFARFGTSFFLRNFHESLFYQDLKTQISSLKEKHQHISVETLECYTKAMIHRSGYEELITSGIPKLIIAGAYDQAISMEDYLKMYELAENADFHMLSNSAHMGMMEESISASGAIKTFLKNNAST